MVQIKPNHLTILIAAAVRYDAGDAVIATTAYGAIVYWNERAESLYGWRTDEALGRNILDVTPTPKTLDEAERLMEQLRRGEPWSGPFIVQRRDGTPIIVEVTNHPVFVENQAIGIVGVSRRKPRNSGPHRVSA
jgi:PAS domain S-box-containing protein